MMNNTSKRLLALILALLVCVSLFPASAVAEGEEEAPEEGTIEALPDNEGEAEPLLIQAAQDDLSVDGTLGTPGESWDELSLEANGPQTVIASGKCGDSLTWTLDEDGLFTITGSGDMWDDNDEYRIFYADDIKEVALPEGLTGIGNYAFCDFRRVSSISIPESVTRIGVAAFGGCTSLSSVTIPESVTNIEEYAFRDCSSLTSVMIPEGVTSIRDGMFMFCSSLTGVTIPESVICIGENAFYGCSSLTSVAIPESVTSIGEYAFCSCSSLMSVTISESVTRIDRDAFYSCSSLTSVTIPECVTYIGYDAFWNCGNLAEIWFKGEKPEFGTEPGHEENRSFPFDCDGATVHFPLSTAWMGVALYYESYYSWVPYGSTSGKCGDNLSWTLDASGLLVITGSGDMWNWDSCNWNIENPNNASPWVWFFKIIKAIVLPEGLTSIGDYAFENCQELTGITIPSTMINIGNGAFSYSGLCSALIPDGVTSIGAYAFYSCSSLTRVTISESVTSIGDYAFSDCCSLTGFKVAEGNAHYASPEGILYSKELTELIQCPARKEGTLSILGSVTCVRNDAFSGCTQLEQITFRGPAPTIGDNSFYKVKTTVYYPNDGTWTQEVRQNYGGTLSWVLNGGTVYFDANGGTVSIESKAVTKDASYGELPTPERRGFCFIGWYTEVEDGEAVTAETIVPTREDHRLYAHWRVSVHTVRYDANGGEGEPDTQTKFTGEALNLSNQLPIRSSTSAGYFTVTLNPNGGSVDMQILRAEQTAIFRFQAWNTATDGSGTNYEPGGIYTEDADVTLFAQWDQSMSTDAVILPVPRRDGYCFLGWATSADASEGVTGSYTPDEDVSLYAVWKEAQGTLSLGKVSGIADSMVVLELNLDKNPGIMMLCFQLEYDRSKLEFLGGEDGSLKGWTFGTAGNGALWDSDGNKNSIGVIVKLFFRILEAVDAGETEIRLTNVEAWNADEEEVRFALLDGGIKVLDYLYGDANGDWEVNILDLVRLRKYLVADSMEISERSADLTGDGKINGQDLIRLRKYLVGDSTAA